MRMKRHRNPMHYTKMTAAFVVALGCWAYPARAQRYSATVPQFEVSAEYSYVRANADNSNGGFNLNGGLGSAAYNFSDRFSVVAEVGAYHFGDLPAGVNSKMFTYLFGPRFAVRKYGRLVPFAQVLLGGGRLNASSGGVDAGENGFAMAVGGGLDLRLRSRFAVRVIDADYLMTRFSSVTGAPATQNDFRISTGIVVRFGHR